MLNWSHLPAIKPKYLAITQFIKQAIQNGDLLPGQRLPAERELATLLHVDRSTVTRALLDLAAVGILVKKRGSGTFVAQLPHVNQLANKVNWQAFLENTTATRHATYQRKLAKARTTATVPLIDAAANELPTNLIPQLGTLTLDWEGFLTAQQQEERTGYLPLMQTINRYHTARQQFTLDRQSLIITGGAQQALLLILNSLLQPGDAVAFVTPSYFSASAVFSAAGVRAYTIPTTTLGLDLTALETAIIKHRIKLLILNPTLQNPTGRILPLAERQAILALCQRYQVAIVEDDVFGWLVDRDIAVPPFKALAPDNVIYISSLSKLLGSNTRIGWIVAPQAIGERIRQVQKNLDLVPSLLAQVMADHALNSPEFSLGVTQLTTQLAQRRQNVTAILRQLRPDWHFVTPLGGFYLWVTQADRNVFEHLLEQHLLVTPGPIYGADRSAFRFNFAGLDYRQQRLLIQRLS